jgi:hypothetical protein
MAIATHLGLDSGHAPKLAQDVAPEQMLDAMEAMQDQATAATHLNQGRTSPDRPERGRPERES